MSDVTRILSQIESGDPSAADQLLPLIYDELRKLAAQKMAHEKSGQTLQATALIRNEISSPIQNDESDSVRGAASGGIHELTQSIMKPKGWRRFLSVSRRLSIQNPCRFAGQLFLDPAGNPVRTFVEVG